MTIAMMMNMTNTMTMTRTITMNIAFSAISSVGMVGKKVNILKLSVESIDLDHDHDHDHYHENCYISHFKC